MVHGGTNFGFFSGANIGSGPSDFQPVITSYDYVSASVEWILDVLPSPIFKFVSFDASNASHLFLILN